jgi:hypothetical protein
MSQQSNSNLTPKNPLGFKIGIHYAWIIIAIAALIHMAGGSIRQAFGVLIIPLEETMGWSPADIALGYSIASLTGQKELPSPEWQLIDLVLDES